MFISATDFPSKLLPQIHQNPQQQKNHDLWKSRSRARGVAKTVFGIPMLHGKHFFFWSPCSVGMRFVTLATPPLRECYFFHFCRTSPARSSKIMKIASWSHAADVSARKMQKANCHQMGVYLSFLMMFIFQWCLVLSLRCFFDFFACFLLYIGKQNMFSALEKK